MTLKNILNPLQEVNGYLASAVFDMSGKVLVKHNSDQYATEMQGTAIIALINACIKTADKGSLGEICSLQISFELGTFCAVWAIENQAIAIALLEPKGNLGFAKMELMKLGNFLLT